MPGFYSRKKARQDVTTVQIAANTKRRENGVAKRADQSAGEKGSG